MIEGACLCGRAGWILRGEPQNVTVCNCSACRRYGVIWAYGWLDHEITVTGETVEYLRGDRSLAFHHCAGCGCVTRWQGTRAQADGRTRVAVNLRLAKDPAAIRDLPVRHFDGADSWTDKDGGPVRSVGDLWI